MRKRALPISQLRRLAQDIRDNHTSFDLDDEAPAEVPHYDARERKWAAEKLTRKPEFAIDDPELTMEDKLDVAIEFWKLHAPGFEATCAVDRAKRITEQYGITTEFIRQCWGAEMSGPGRTAPVSPMPEADIFEDFDLELEDDDVDLDSLWDEMEAGENKKDDPDPHPEGDDAHEVSDEEDQTAAQSLLDDAGVTDRDPDEVPF